MRAVEVVGHAESVDPGFPADPSALEEALTAASYIPEPGVATLAWLAHGLQRPLLLEGEPGAGKTALAEALAELQGVPLVRLQCYEGIDATQALYDWDFTRQILHLRAVEAVGGRAGDVAGLEDEIFDERFLVARPVLTALRDAPCVLLIDEIDRADDEFEAFLLEALSTWSLSIPELGTIRADPPPLTVLTSNRTRELHDALKRRCLYHWLEHPTPERELAIVRARLPEVEVALAEQLVGVVQQLRSDETLQRPPGVAETLDWARALHALHTGEVDPQVLALTIGAAVKVKEDRARVLARLDRLIGG